MDDPAHPDAEEDVAEPDDESDIQHPHRLVERVDENEARERARQELRVHAEVPSREDADDDGDGRGDEEDLEHEPQAPLNPKLVDEERAQGAENETVPRVPHAEREANDEEGSEERGRIGFPVLRPSVERHDELERSHRRPVLERHGGVFVVARLPEIELDVPEPPRDIGLETPPVDHTHPTLEDERSVGAMEVLLDVGEGDPLAVVVGEGAERGAQRDEGARLGLESFDLLLEGTPAPALPFDDRRGRPREPLGIAANAAEELERLGDRIGLAPVDEGEEVRLPVRPGDLLRMHEGVELLEPRRALLGAFPDEHPELDYVVGSRERLDRQHERLPGLELAHEAPAPGELIAPPSHLRLKSSAALRHLGRVHRVERRVDIGGADDGGAAPQTLEEALLRSVRAEELERPFGVIEKRRVSRG